VTGARLGLSFTVTLLAAFSVVFASAMALAVFGYQRAGSRAALAEAERRIVAAAHEAAARMRLALRPAEAKALLPAAASRVALFGPVAVEEAAGLAALLSAEPAAVAVGFARPDGAWLEAIRASALPPGLARDGAAIALRQVPPGTAGASVPEIWRFVDRDGAVSDEVLRALPWQDPRSQPWHEAASGPGLHVSPVGPFGLASRPGFAVSRRAADHSVIVAFFGLEEIARMLDAARPNASALPVLFSGGGALLGHPVPERVLLPDAAPPRGVTLATSGSPALASIWEAMARGDAVAGMALRLAGREGLLAAVAPVEGDYVPPLMLGVSVPVADVTAPVREAVGQGMLLAAVAFAGGLAAIGVLAARVARPLATLTGEADRIRALDLAGTVPVRSRITEVRRLAGAMDQMKAALRQFAAYVPADIVRRQIAAGEGAPPLAERRSITVLFSDVEGFTTLVERLPPETLMRAMNAYFPELTDALTRCGATIDKFIGDSVMAFWNAPRPDALHAYWACEGARAARAAGHALAARAAAEGWPAMRTRFGVHTGEAVVGIVGSRQRMSYTAMGATVNLASRLEGLNKYYGTEIILSEPTRLAAGDGFLFRPVDLVLPKGATEPVGIFELLGRAGRPDPAVPPALLSALPAWEEMVAHYRAGRFAEAEAALAAAAVAGDRLGDAYAQRLAALRSGAPPGWTPVIRFDRK
jgi:adenylate cyclase